MKPALVDYSDSDDSAQDTAPAVPARNLKRKRDGMDTNAVSSLPPLPATFHDLYASTARASSQDDSKMHGGRQRNIEEIPIHSLLKSDLGAELPLHISLSRPITLLTDHRQPFAELLEQTISRSSTRPFVVSVKGVDWIGNLEKTRWFLILRIDKPDNDGLGKLLQVTNQAVERSGQPPLYSTSQSQSPNTIRARGAARTNRSARSGRAHVLQGLRQSRNPGLATNDEDLSSHFHISIGWILEPPSTDLVERTKSTSLEKIMTLRIPVNAIKIKIGNTITLISLPTKVEEGRGLIGA
ncbi:MAG: hypothetical protein LQ347_006553 [Umbilicaria vellea]|nr:MAG: hypothetical protein LQ347_006553 [Umbilicaria vellea]